ncbi:unnamed protein product [Nesidiocoris tenuis]|uniref:Reverse transcriptase zinc-binding domain-containing protein n=1 Tax=Nesidiocoris tenuis TaxID=355587 RepID=A0A6H5GM48_9HEMI|nr:unnamed protein product [Nesidiocoris tenuis]
MLSLSRINIRVLTGVLTGHCPLRYHLNKMGLGEITECRLCGGGEETAEHLLCDCPAAAYARFRHLGSGLLQPEALQRVATKNILAFLKERTDHPNAPWIKYIKDEWKRLQTISTSTDCWPIREGRFVEHRARATAHSPCVIPIMRSHGEDLRGDFGFRERSDQLLI